MNKNVYEQRLRGTTKTTKELIKEKKQILQLLSLQAMLGEKSLSDVSRISNQVNSAYDQYIPEEPKMFGR